MDVPFTSSDIWVLLSIALAESEPPVRLSDVFFAGDAINKAVFTAQELRRGFAKLTRAGYVRDDLGVYSLTQSGRDLIEDARKANDMWMSIWHYLEKQLGATRGAENAPQHEDLRFPYPQLTDEAVAQAHQEYRAHFAKLLAELNSG